MFWFKKIEKFVDALRWKNSFRQNQYFRQLPHFHTLLTERYTFWWMIKKAASQAA